MTAPKTEDVNWLEHMDEYNSEALRIGSAGDHRFDEAIIGIGLRCAQPAVFVYSYEKIVRVLVQDGLDRDEAEEYVSFNIIGAWMGPHTPIVMV